MNANFGSEAVTAAQSEGRIALEFEAGVIMPCAPAASTRTFKLGWFVQSVDVSSASVRYRCFHFARVLAPTFASRFFTSASEVQKALHDLDAIIIVKRIDRPAVEVAASARAAGVPLFLDLCDDLIDPQYSKNERGLNLLNFLAIASVADGITVPSAAMAERIEAYASRHAMWGVRVAVIPDIAEDWETYRATHRAIADGDLPPLPKNGRASSYFAPKRVVWFGNYGASHSNFGIFSLKSSLKAFKAINADIPLELVVVSNSEVVYKALVHNCGFPTRYVSWSPTAVYSELEAADVALLTTGDDEFCVIKSSNRVLQALAAGVPVVTSKSSSLAEFEDVIFSGRMEDSLRLCLGPGRKRVVDPRLKSAQRLLERYRPERLAGLWRGLLTRAIDARAGRPPDAEPKKLLFVFEPGDSVEAAKGLLAEAKRLKNLDYDVLIATELLEKQPEFRAVPRLARPIPRFYSGKLKGAGNLLLNRTAIVVERLSAPVAKELEQHAREIGVEVLATKEAAGGALQRLAAGEQESPLPETTIRAGPNEERLDPDGTAEWSFIVHRNARGWILDAICREIGSRQSQSWTVCYHPAPSPPARNYFFSHYLLLENYIERQPETLKGANVFVWYTHPRDEDPVTVAKQLLAFEKVTKVVFACESNRRVWLDRGLPEDKTAVVLGAADPMLFRYHERGSGVVGLSSSFYERKNPDLLMEVMKALPGRRFVLLGRKWNQYALFEEMKALPNFTYLSPSYAKYPDLYSTFDVFLSISTLEGGPIPLVEAMMSNAVPVASRTGFAPDLIKQGENGFIFELDAPASRIAELIEEAFKLRTNVRETVKGYDWDNFSAEIVKLAE